MDIRPLKIPNEDPLEVYPVTDAVVWEEFKPRPNMFPHIDGEILNDEIVIIHPSGSVGGRKCCGNGTLRILGFVSSVYLVMLVGSRKRCGNGTLWIRQPKAHGPGPSGLGLWSSSR